ncbi:helix-turn-helix domain-containing protein [Sphingobacterium thalpophilum]|uniref:DNA-binding transcriptional regulator AraC n=1 Tax=Sphingobacterium thalpophilum TaxID=259 RepID=A0A4U9U9C8_9SPHI|nr:AraC family transcriptional regulator [Sphingobacterium thalpophilum]VTR28479.1 DNA-binding transcriptional regulator AraC [Sphingobacterium thalpophilum]
MPKFIKTISEYHRYRGLTQPYHPMISVVDYNDIRSLPEEDVDRLILDFYAVSLKRTKNAKIIYGQQRCDFDSGVLFFMAPRQVFTIQSIGNSQPQHTGWLLLIHPDFLWNTHLASAIGKYDFFEYEVNEALFLSDSEESVLTGIIKYIDLECRTNLDRFSQNIIIAQIETLLRYSERFYQRQFITRKIGNHEILGRMERILNEYILNNAVREGLPTVHFIAEALSMSPGYLSGVLKSVTGESTQQHIHNKLIAVAKEKLTTTTLTVSEIAYELGFEHPQGFSKLFKHKTNVTPMAFRRSFIIGVDQEYQK